MRDIQSNLDKPEVQTAYNIFIDRIRKYIGSYVTVMNGVDAIVFTAGIGENAVGVRKDIIDGMTWFGCEIDDDKIMYTVKKQLSQLMIQKSSFY